LARLQGAVARGAQGVPQLLVVAGARRVGKTFLLHHLLDQVPADVTPIREVSATN
jgi:predicted AAA+ superfamily ATPase